MGLLNVDLHCHTDHSDGTLSPADLIARALCAGVDVLSITDHDSLSSWPDANIAAENQPITLIPGVEVSACFLSKSVHIVGLGIDTHCTVLADNIANIQCGRGVRAEKIAADLERVGIQNALSGALRYARLPHMIGRPHFARYLVELGVVANIGQAFCRYLSEGKPGYVPLEWASIENAVSWIRAAGGIAVLAHPGRYSFDTHQMDALLDHFVSVGGRAIEVVTSSHSFDKIEQFQRVALRYGLLASRGSDFHDPDESLVDLGAIPALSDKLTPVWSELLDIE